MIVQHLLNFFSSIVSSLVDGINFANDTFSGIATSFVAVIQQAGQHISIIDPFIPVQSVVLSLSQAALIVLLVMGVWVGRFVVSVFTGGGGSIE